MSKSGLSAVFVATVRRPGKYYDLFGLYLRVERTGRRYWEQRFTVRRRRRTVGIGPYPDVKLKAARDAALENLRLARRGEHPVDGRRCAAVPTFKEAAKEVLKLYGPEWSNPRQADIWYSSLERYVFPTLGNKPVSEITSGDLMEVLVPIWTSLHDTARRVRQRVGTVMKWAVAQRYRTDNPAEAVLGALPRIKRSKVHYPALPHAEVAGAIALVHGSTAFLGTRLAFEFLVLTATRSGEVRPARWEEIDREAAVWTIPAKRMKARQAHRVPLSGRACQVLDTACREFSNSGLVFPSPTGKVISNGTLSNLLKRRKIKAVPHGFRSSFRDWCGESGVAREVAEACLAHVLGPVEGAYARSDLYDLRVPVMEDWARYLTADVDD